MGRITIFTDAFCVASVSVTELLKQHDLPFVEINVSEEVGKLKEVQSHFLRHSIFC